MAKHEEGMAIRKTVEIVRPWSKIDPKVIVGAVSSLTVGGIVSAGAAVGWNIPTPVAAIVVIVAYFVASYLTKTRIPVAPESGLTEQQALAAASASGAGDELADGDVRQSLADAFAAAGYALDKDGNVVSGPNA